jgi:hypothetical protein
MSGQMTAEPPQVKEKRGFDERYHATSGGPASFRLVQAGAVEQSVLPFVGEIG